MSHLNTYYILHEDKNEYVKHAVWLFRSPETNTFKCTMSVNKRKVIEKSPKFIDSFLFFSYLIYGIHCVLWAVLKIV